MYRILLVEDEATVREGILKKIKWEDHGFVLAGACENGRQALDILRAGPVEVVITDINMPVMDGLELAGRIHEHWPGTRVVILTGYDDFSYAQTAIRYRVSEYILKPITARQLRELLDRLRGELDARLSGDEQLRELHRQHLISRLLAEEIPPDKLAGLLRETPLALEKGPACVALVGPMRQETAERLRTTAQRMDAAVELMEETAKDRLILLCGGERPEQTALNIIQAVGQTAELPLTAAVGTPAEELGSLRHSFDAAQNAWEHLFCMPPGAVHMAAEILSRTPVEPVLGDARRSILRGVKLLNPEQAQQGLAAFLADLRGSTWPRAAILSQLQKLTHLLSEYADEQGFATPDSLLDGLEHSHHLNQAGELMARYMQELIHRAQQLGDTSSRQGMLAVEYIKEHYNEPDLSLQNLTAYLSMSTSSFSVLFKAYTGATFVEFLTRLRINKAQELILSTDKKNYEIADAIGYDDPGYFRTIFKKYTGLSPSEYRKTHRG